MKLKIVIMVMVLLVSCKNKSGDVVMADQNERHHTNNYKYTDQINSLVKQYQDLDIFSGVVLVTEMGKPLYQKAFGLSNRETKTPNSINTKFDIGSMNKTFTNAILMQLIDEGKLKKDEKLGTYLKNFPKEPSEKVTIEHLINHTSGYGDYLAEPGFFDLPKSEQTLLKIIERVKRMPLHFQPGDERQYSNAGYIVLGAIIEAVTGKSYYANVEERIIKPLGLKNTVVDEKKEMTEGRAIGYYKNTMGELFNNKGILMIPSPAGGFIATAEDVATFYRAYFMGDKLFSEKAANSDGLLSFARSKAESGKAMPIAGGFEGANSIVYAQVADDIFIVVLANMDEPVAEHLGKGIFSIINDKEPKKPLLKPNQLIYEAFKNNGIEYVKNNFEILTENFPEHEPKDFLLNQIGYDVLFSGDTNGAVNIFKLNTELFPNIANTWDSYGEALHKQGKNAESLKAYKRALQIRPDLPSAKEMISKIKI